MKCKMCLKLERFKEAPVFRIFMVDSFAQGSRLNTNLHSAHWCYSGVPFQWLPNVEVETKGSPS